MKIEEIKGQRVLTPDADKWLYNEKDKVVSDKVYLGINASADDWTEITEERKQELEAMWYEDATSGDTATEEDYQNALAQFGVML